MSEQIPEKLEGGSLDISADNKAKLKQLFPSVFTETANDKGEIVEYLDLTKLRAELGEFTEAFESRRERYGMDWPGKKDALRQIQIKSYATLKPCKEESVNFDTTENLFIEGDNLEVLKLLQKSYYGKVKVLYFDPPYNTGKEFIYPDNYSESLETYLEFAGLADSTGKKFSTNMASEGRFHTKWMNMMYPRLYLARNLLKEEGIIFISIDDNEVSNLRKICDEIFGEDNFIGIFTINTTPNARDYGHIGKMHEYCLFYSKNYQVTETYMIEDEDKTFKYKDTIGEFNIHPLYNSNEAFTNENRPNLYYPFYLYIDKPILELGDNFFEIGLVNSENAVEIYPPLSQKNQVQFVWRWGKEKSNNELNKEIVGYLTEDEEYRIVQKMRTSVKLIRSIIDGKSVTTRRGTKEVEELLGNKVASFPKSKELIKLFLMAGLDKDDLVLDIFAGSCTTAHALFELNNSDNGSRNFICIQLPEPTYEIKDKIKVPKKDSTKAFKAGFETIADIGKERIRRVIKKLNEADSEKLDLEKNAAQDRGFRVFKLDKSNFKQWQQLAPDSAPEKIADQLELHVEHINSESSPEDLLYEIILKAGFKLSEKVESKSVVGKTVYLVAEGALLLCLEATVTKELIEAILELNPLHFYCLDSAFGGNDQLKANVVQTINAYNAQKEKHNQIVFNTI